MLVHNLNLARLAGEPEGVVQIVHLSWSPNAEMFGGSLTGERKCHEFIDQGRPGSRCRDGAR